MTYKGTFLILFLSIFFGCSKPETDAELLQLDQKKIVENLDYDKITFYKFAKIAIRSSAVQDTSDKTFQQFKTNANHLLQTLHKVDPKSNEQISAIDALLIYKDYQAVKRFVKETDEDVFPTLMEGINKLNTTDKNNFELLNGNEKTEAQNIEHAILSTIVLATRSLGQPFALYECSKTQPEKLPDHEIKTLLEFVRGFLFFSNNLYY
ncbi:MAG: short-chain dehydrogenase, partial [Flavobacterium sp.]